MPHNFAADSFHTKKLPVTLHAEFCIVWWLTTTTMTNRLTQVPV